MQLSSRLARLPAVTVCLALVPLACSKPSPPESEVGGQATAAPTEPDPAEKQGMVSCYYIEIPDAPTLQLWLVAGEGSRVYAMASSAGSESPDPGAERRLSGFSAEPGAQWPLGRYRGSKLELEITGAAADGEWKGRVREDGDHAEELSCAYYD